MNNKKKLRVSLLNFIPFGWNDEKQYLVQWIKSKFQREFPGIDLDLKRISFDYDIYDLDQLRKFLSPLAGDKQLDLVELDAPVALNELIREGLVSPFKNVIQREWMPAALDTVLIDGEFYGIPTWICSYFMISSIKEIFDCNNITDFIARNNIAIFDFSDSFNIIFYYWFSVMGEHGYIDKSFLENLDHAALYNIAALLKTSYTADCFTGVYFNPNFAVKKFLEISKGLRQFSPLICSFFEDILHHLKKVQQVHNVFFEPFRFSNKQKQPMLSCNAFVKRKGCDDDAAEKFVEFMTRPDIQAAIIAAEDQMEANNSVPVSRYLIPANKTVLTRLPDDLYVISQAFSKLALGKSIDPDLSCEIMLNRCSLARRILMGVVNILLNDGMMPVPRMFIGQIYSAYMNALDIAFKLKRADLYENLLSRLFDDRIKQLFVEGERLNTSIVACKTCFFQKQANKPFLQQSHFQSEAENQSVNSNAHVL